MLSEPAVAAPSHPELTYAISVYTYSLTLLGVRVTKEGKMVSPVLPKKREVRV